MPLGLLNALPTVNLASSEWVLTQPCGSASTVHSPWEGIPAFIPRGVKD